MPKINVKGHELSDVDVVTVSLVKRGANRVPFRIVKNEGDGPMINFGIGNLAQVFRKTDAGPAIVAIAVSAEADLEQAVARIAKAGFKTDTMTEQDGVRLFAQVEGEVTDPVVLKMDDGVAVLLTGLKKALVPTNFDSTEFGEVFAQQGFAPGFGLALGILQDTFFNILSKAESPDQLTSLLGGAIGDFKSYVETLASDVPAAAFTVDLFKAEDEDGNPFGKKKKAKKDGDDATDTTPTDASEGGEPEPAKAAAPADAEPAKAADADPGAQAGGDGDGDGGSAGLDVGAIAKAAAEAAVAALTPQIAALSGAISGGIEGLTEKMAALDARMGSVETISKSADEAVRGMTGGGAGTNDGQGDRPNGLDTSRGGEPPLIDTAYDSMRGGK